ncbi:hypothetical protein [Planococcus sp. ANT_H30]|uniref:hypothetical protein n=1 Tax=Planococcus sp. ANT_H30 TaxID=2597347 RepID=UPI00165DBACC|nr:hypothetical protein [Planococcus sp. ANT_H30]
MKKLELLMKIDAQIEKLNESIESMEETLEMIKTGLDEDQRKVRVIVDVQA